MAIKYNALAAITLLGLLTHFSLSAQTCNDSIVPSTPDSRFVINGDGTVTDNQTGLMWMRCSLGQTWDGNNCTGSANTYNWQSALTAAKGVEYSGYDDWYLPNIIELTSIIENACYEPAINEVVFPDTPLNSYWSSSSFARNNNYAWEGYFYLGNNSYTYKSHRQSVRLVRTDQ